MPTNRIIENFKIIEYLHLQMSDVNFFSQMEKIIALVY
jgi:hypothetical protein